MPEVKAQERHAQLTSEAELLERSLSQPLTLHLCCEIFTGCVSKIYSILTMGLKSKLTIKNQVPMMCSSFTLQGLQDHAMFQFGCSSVH